MVHRSAFAAALLLLASLPAGPAAAETISLDYESYPSLGAAMNRAQSKQQGTEQLFSETIARERLYYQSRLVVEGKSADDWTEAFEIVNTYRGLEPPSAKSWYKRFRRTSDEKCPSQWRVISENKDGLTFERTSPDCPAQAAQTALYRVLYGGLDVFALAAIRKGSMPPATRDAWLQVLATAELRR